MIEGYTPVPNIYIDEHLADLSGAETKLLFAILRKTAGWRKEQDEISLSQLEQMTGLDRKSVIVGLRGLLERRLIAQVKAAAGSRAASYRCVIPSPGGGKTPPEEGDQWKNSTSSGGKIPPVVVEKFHPQKKKEKRKDSARDARALSPAQSASGNTRDYLDHVLERLDGHDPIERTIRAWSLPPHLEAQCLAFARVFEVTPTKGDKARWAKGAETLHELRCDEARLKAARDEARRAHLICTWPGALVNLQAIRSIQQEYELVYDEERNVYIRQPKWN